MVTPVRGRGSTYRTGLGRARADDRAHRQHIGPLRGKPIIDIQVAVEEAKVARAIAAVEDLGYRHHGQGSVPGREYLASRPADGPPVNLYVFGAHSSLLADNRIVRDYLRAHPDAGREYVESKEQRTPAVRLPPPGPGDERLGTPPVPLSTGTLTFSISALSLTS